MPRGGGRRCCLNMIYTSPIQLTDDIFPMSLNEAPVLKHRTWRHLLRAFTDSHRPLQAIPNAHLELLLTPAASIAWWLAKHVPSELLERDMIRILAPGAGPVECTDGGRWLSFLPWLIGRPQLQVRVILVGDELARTEDSRQSTRGCSIAQLERQWSTPYGRVVSTRPASTIFNGTLAEWHKQDNAGEIDACVLFAPGFTSHYREWLTEADLLPLLRRDLPMGVFSYSKLDGIEDQYMLSLVGLELEPHTLQLNPWHVAHEMTDAMGAFARFFWPLRVIDTVPRLDLENSAIADFEQLQAYARQDFMELGADQAIERLGARWEVERATKKQSDSIIILPREHAVLESTGEVGDFDDSGFIPFARRLVVPAERIRSRPADEHLMDRILWALRLHRDVIAPQLRERENEEHQSDRVFGDLSMDDLNEGMRDFLQRATGTDIDPDEFIEQMRASGGIHGPTHHIWYDLLSSLEWPLEEWVDGPDRLEPAFWAPATRRGQIMPVICESYVFFPDDEADILAHQAMSTVAQKYPDGALLLFKSMPYQEVQGHRYNFGGMLWRKGRWSPFALNESVKSADDVIDQIESGFSFTRVDIQYADDASFVTVPFNLMSHGEDPNANASMGSIQQGKWIMIMPV
jgi:hypothetical protein